MGEVGCPALSDRLMMRWKQVHLFHSFYPTILLGFPRYLCTARSLLKGIMGSATP